MLDGRDLRGCHSQLFLDEQDSKVAQIIKQQPFVYKKGKHRDADGAATPLTNNKLRRRRAQNLKRGDADTKRCGTPGEEVSRAGTGQGPVQYSTFSSGLH